MNIITCFYVFKSYIAALIGTKEMYFIKLHLIRVNRRLFSQPSNLAQILYHKIYSFSLNFIFHMSNGQYLEYLLCVDVLNYTFVIQWTSQ